MTERPDPATVITEARLERAAALSPGSPIAQHAIAVVRTTVAEDLAALTEAGWTLHHPDAPRETPHMTYCRSCHTRIVWAITERRGVKGGKAMPVDADPHPEGNVELRAGENDQLIAVVHGQAPLGVDVLYRSHFVTCPNASMHRRRDGRAAA